MEGTVTGIPATRFRPSAKAVVVVDGRLLVTRNRTPGGSRPDWYILPGGGQRPGETIVDALRREVEEETGLLVEPVRLLWVREWIIAMREPDVQADPEEHAIEFMFESRLIGGDGGPRETDAYQVGVEWMAGEGLGSVRFYPAAIVVPIVDLIAGRSPGPVYLGDAD